MLTTGREAGRNPAGACIRGIKVRQRKVSSACALAAQRSLVCRDVRGTHSFGIEYLMKKALKKSSGAKIVALPRFREGMVMNTDYSRDKSAKQVICT